MRGGCRNLLFIIKCTFKHCTNYNENLNAVALENKIIRFDKPIYIGNYILDFIFYINTFIFYRICSVRHIEDVDVRLSL